jgi:hypothetical protein
VKLVRAGSAAKIIGLPPNIFRHRYAPWHKNTANRILHHLILAWKEPFRLALALEFPESLPKKKVQYCK